VNTDLMDEEIRNLKAQLLEVNGTKDIQIISPRNPDSYRVYLSISIIPEESIFKGDGTWESDEFEEYREVIYGIVGSFNYRYAELRGGWTHAGYEFNKEHKPFSNTFRIVDV
jgi:hypothetical protein